MPFSTPEECVKGMFLTAGATKETGRTQSCGELRGVRGRKPEPPVSGFHVCVFSIWVNVDLCACTLTPGCRSCWGLDRLMFSAQRSVAPLQPWWFSGLSWKSHTIHWHWSWKWKHSEHQTLNGIMLPGFLWSVKLCQGAKLLHGCSVCLDLCSTVWNNEGCVSLTGMSLVVNVMKVNL